MAGIDELKKEFANPLLTYRSAPFWAWDDRMDPEELARQVKNMEEHGMGGFFMHSREGLETEYMRDDWMKCIKETIRAARETGMAAWLYDEDRWPSGWAGGLVQAKGGDAFRAKVLTLQIVKGPFQPDDKVFAMFRAKMDGKGITACRRTFPGEDHDATGLADEALLVFRREVSDLREWYNNEAPPDNMNPESVRAFLDTTYERYRQEVGDEFGKTVPGIFTDEPNIAGARGKFLGNDGLIYWTDGFMEYFKCKRGYDFLEALPYIFLHGDKSAKSRHDYWRTVTDRFCEAYSKQIGEWCEKNNLIFTGHYLYEDELGDAIRVNGAVMPHYRYHQMPGIDMLCEQTCETLTVKQCTSVAHQYGRERVLSETYGCTGWDFTFEGQKWVGDWQYVLGVNLRCQHLALYSLKGCRKRDYPPVFNYNTSWWKYNPIVEDYFARIASVMTKGQIIRDVLVIHPVSTAWSMIGGCSQSPGYSEDESIVEVNRYGEEFKGFVRALLGAHHDLDLGDETIMEEKGRIEEGKIFINLAGYSAVILPSCKTLLRSTVKLLADFCDADGKVIAVKPLPDMVEGEISDIIYNMLGNEGVIIAEDMQDAIRKLETVMPRRISIENIYGTQAPEILYMLRDLGDCMALFAVNNDRNNSCETDITLSFSGAVEEWDLLSGKTCETAVKVKGNGVVIPAVFGPAGSRLYMINKTAQPRLLTGCEKTIRHHYLHRKLYGVLGPVCRFTRTVPNALTLDMCKYRVKEGSWSKPADVWLVQKEIREGAGMRQVYYNGLPQRYKWANEPHPADGLPVDFKFEFHVKDIPVNPVFLVLESSSCFSAITLNGQTVINKPDGWFLDRAFDRIPLPCLKSGVNELVLACLYKNSMEMEDCYLIGDFGVDTSRNIIKEPERLRFGDWCLQGYLHYCGSMVYHFDFIHEEGRKAILQLGACNAVTVEVRVNGRMAGHIPWRAANEVDITGYLTGGENRIDIEVMGSPRNLLGPLHQAATTHTFTDWSSFRRQDREYTGEYVTKPYGLMEQVNIYEE